MADVEYWINRAAFFSESLDCFYGFGCAFVPCDHMAVSGARWFKGKGLRKLSESIALFAAATEILNAGNAPGFIENPVSTISTYWRKPDYTFHPYYFTGYDQSDNYTKKTCLWSFNGWELPSSHRNIVLGAPDDRIHKAPPGDNRAAFRAATPNGFAIANFNHMAEQN